MSCLDLTRPDPLDHLTGRLRRADMVKVHLHAVEVDDSTFRVKLILVFYRIGCRHFETIEHHHVSDTSVR